MQQLRAGAFKKTTLWILASPIILLVLTGFVTTSAEARQRQQLASASLAALKSRLAHTVGFRIETLRVTDGGAACIQYRTLDGGGELQRGQAVVVGTEVALDDRRDDRFEQAWNRQCLGRAYDVTAAFP